jgi:hypothetical protein
VSPRGWSLARRKTIPFKKNRSTCDRCYRIEHGDGASLSIVGLASCISEIPVASSSNIACLCLSDCNCFRRSSQSYTRFSHPLL